MRDLRKPVYLLMALAVLSSPLLACTLTGMTMSEEEKECCRRMADQCGSMQMEDSHSCCTKTPDISAGALQVTDKYSPSVPDCVSYASPALAPALRPQAGPPPAAFLEHCESPPGDISVLRI